MMESFSGYDILLTNEHYKKTSRLLIGDLGYPLFEVLLRVFPDPTLFMSSKPSSFFKVVSTHLWNTIGFFEGNPFIVGERVIAWGLFEGCVVTFLEVWNFFSLTSTELLT